MEEMQLPPKSNIIFDEASMPIDKLTLEAVKNAFRIMSGVPQKKRGRPKKDEVKPIKRTSPMNTAKYTFLAEVLDNPDKMACIVHTFVDFIVNMKGKKIGVGEAHISRFIQAVFTKIKLTEEEIQLLKLLPEDFRYIARNENGNLNAFKTKPTKKYTPETSYWLERKFLETRNLKIFNHLFKFIEFTDDEPYEIAKLLEAR